MRQVWSSPAAETFQGNNQPLYVQQANTLRTGFFNQQYNLMIDHQQEEVLDGGFAETMQFHYPKGYVLNDNGANLASTAFSIDANNGLSGTANYVMPRRPRVRRGQI